MKPLLSAYPLLAQPIDFLEPGEEHGASAPPDRNGSPVIRQFYLQANLFWRGRPDVLLPVTVIIDTGSDLTQITADALERLEKLQRMDGHDLAELIWIDRKIRLQGVLRPSYDLALMLPGEQHIAFSPYGFLCDARRLGADVLLGQDILNRWIVTLDGVNGVLTISEP